MPEVTMDIDISHAMAGFDKLNYRARRDVINSAKRAAGSVLRKRAAALAPVGSYHPSDQKVLQGYRNPGALKRSLKRAKTGLKVTRRNKNVFVVAGLSDEDPYYARWVSQGHTIRRERKGPILGYVQPNPFMELAAEQTGPAAIAAFQKKFFERVNVKLKSNRNLMR